MNIKSHIKFKVAVFLILFCNLNVFGQKENMTMYMSIDDEDSCYFFTKNKHDSLIVETYYASLCDGGILHKGKEIYKCKNCQLLRGSYNKYYSIRYSLNCTGGYKPEQRQYLDHICGNRDVLLDKNFKPILEDSFINISHHRTEETIGKNGKKTEYAFFHTTNKNLNEGIFILDVNTQKVVEWISENHYSSLFSYSNYDDDNILFSIINQKDSMGKTDTVFFYYENEKLTWSKKKRKQVPKKPTKEYDSPRPIIEDIYRRK